MNYLLTTKCNKNCPYCFARETRNSMGNQEMPLDFFKELIYKFKDDNHITLLGGEPTNYTHFSEVVDFLSEQHREFMLVSNFLFNNKIKEKLEDTIKNSNTPLYFSANGTDLNIQDRMHIWSKNYNGIYYALKERNVSDFISVSITLMPNKTPKFYIDYLNYLLSNIEEIKRLRFSLEFPSNGNKDPYKYINNFNVGRMIKEITSYCLSHSILPFFDCVIYPCLFENFEDYRYIRNFLLPLNRLTEENPIGRHPYICNNPPIDISPTGEAWYCYPLKDSIKIDNILNYRSTNQIINRMNNSKRILENSIKFNKKMLPEECKYCKFHTQKFCMGPNLCHFCV